MGEKISGGCSSVPAKLVERKDLDRGEQNCAGMEGTRPAAEKSHTSSTKLSWVSGKPVPARPSSAINADEKAFFENAKLQAQQIQAAQRSSSTVVSELQRQLGLTARVPVSVLENVNTAFDATIGAVVNATVDRINENIPGKIPHLPSTAEALRESTSALPKPSGAIEEIVHAGAQGLTTGGLGLGVATILKGGQVANAITSSPLISTLSPATSELSGKSAEQAGLGPTAQLAAGLAGGLSPAAAAKIPSAVATMSSQVVVANPLKDARKLLQEFQKRLFRPINVPTGVRVSDVARQHTSDVAALKKMGVGFHETDDVTSLKGHVVFWKNTSLDRGASEADHFGKMLVIDRLPSPDKAAGPFVNALRHPEMAAYKEQLESMGYRLTVDTSIPFTGAGAYQWTYNKVIALRPDSTWQTFVHEYQHAQFATQIEGKMFGAMQISRRLGAPLKDMLSPEAVRDIGEARLASLERLIDKGLPQNAVNETLSVEAELAALGFRQYIPFVGSGSERYALRHQITDLTKVVEERGLALTPVQQKTLAEAKRKYALLIGRDAVGATATYAAGIGGAAKGIVEVADLFRDRRPEDYVQIIYDKDNHMFGQKPDGTWEYLSKKP